MISTRQLALRSFLLSLFCTGCLSLGSAQRASTVGKGKFEAGVEAGAWAFVMTSPQLASAANAPQWAGMPGVNGVFRYGVAEHVDLGLRTGGPFGELHAKFRLTESASRVAFSIVPSLGGFYVPSMCMAATTNTCGDAVGGAYFTVPLLFGVKLGNGHELVIGGREVNAIYFRKPFEAARASQTVVMGLGASLGFALRVRDNLTIMPEVSFVAPVFQSPAGVYAGNGFGVGTIQLNGGIAFLWGNTNSNREDAHQ